VPCADKFAANDFALLFGVGNASQVMQKFGTGINVDYFHAEIFGEGFHHLFGLVQTQQAVVHEHASQLIADGAMDQRRRH
jgi:hypothetical protein